MGAEGGCGTNLGFRLEQRHCSHGRVGSERVGAVGGGWVGARWMAAEWHGVKASEEELLLLMLICACIAPEP